MSQKFWIIYSSWNLNHNKMIEFYFSCENFEQFIPVIQITFKSLIICEFNLRFSVFIFRISLHRSLNGRIIHSMYSVRWLVLFPFLRKSALQSTSLIFMLPLQQLSWLSFLLFSHLKWQPFSNLLRVRKILLKAYFFPSNWKFRTTFLFTSLYFFSD